MSPKKVLAVDDEQHILELIQYNLESNGYEVTTSDNGEDALNYVRNNTYDVILLDIMLPGMDGLEVCKKIRNELKKNIPIIMLTAKSEELDTVLGLELGADDYLTKPFGIRELMARIKAVLRRYDSAAVEENAIVVGDIVINNDKHEVMKNEKVLDLTLKEFELLKTLALNRGRVLTRDYLLDTVWGYDYIGETRTVDVHIRYLRKKLDDSNNIPKYIETIRGIGYKMK